MDQHSQQPHEAVATSETRVEREIAELLQGKSKKEILELATGFQGAYNNILGVRHNAQKASAWHFFDILGEAYPEATHPQKMQVAKKLAGIVKADMGEAMDVPQSELLAASMRRDVAVQELARRFTADEIEDLNEQMLMTFSGELPDNYDERKAEWLAEWVVKGRLDFGLKP